MFSAKRMMSTAALLFLAGVSGCSNSGVHQYALKAFGARIAAAQYDQNNYPVDSFSTGQPGSGSASPALPGIGPGGQ